MEDSNGIRYNPHWTMEIEFEVTRQFRKLMTFVEQKDSNGLREWVAAIEPQSPQAIHLYGFIGALSIEQLDSYRWVMASLSKGQGFEEHVAAFHISEAKIHGHSDF